MWLGLFVFLVKLLLYRTQGSVKGDRTISSVFNSNIPIFADVYHVTKLLGQQW